MIVGVNVNSWNIAKVLAAKPLLITDLGVHTEVGGVITSADITQHNKAIAACKAANVRYGRYLNASIARVGDTWDQGVYPFNAIMADALPESVYHGAPYELRKRGGISCMVRRFSLEREENRARIADEIIRLWHDHKPACDLYLDGCSNPDTGCERVPWDFAAQCDLLAKVRQRLPSSRRLHANIAGYLSSWKPADIDRVSVALGGQNNGCITFEQVASNNGDAWVALLNAKALVRAGVVPVLMDSLGATVAEFCDGAAISKSQ